MVNSINESLFLADRQKNDRKTGQSSLDQDAFLKILITQLQNQDPSKPMEDKEFISQMANFSSLEQMTQMNKNLNSFIEMQRDSQFLSLSQLIGKEIKWEQTVADTEGETTTRVLDDAVKAISFQNGQSKLVLDSGQAIDPNQIIHIARSSSEEK